MEEHVSESTDDARIMRTLKARVQRSLHRGVRQRIWTRIIDNPVLARAYYRLDPDVRDLRLRAETDLVVEGFPRSANTYTAEAIKLANPEITLTHHLHQPLVIEWAVARGVPTILTIREPDAVVASLTAFTPGMQPEAIYTAYAEYYERLLPLVPHLVIADFNQLTTDIGCVLSRVQTHYGMTLRAPRSSDQSEIWARVEAFSAQHFGQDDFEAKVARPSEHPARRRRLDEDVPEEVRQRAHAAYEAVHTIDQTRLPFQLSD